MGASSDARAAEPKIPYKATSLWRAYTRRYPTLATGPARPHTMAPRVSLRHSPSATMKSSHEETPDKSTGAANPSRRTFLRRSIPLVPATLAAASGAGAVAVASSAANHLPEVPGPRVDPQLGAAASYTPAFSAPTNTASCRRRWRG